MRKFNYITDYSLINSSVRGYIIELEKELAMLIDMEEDNNIYIETYRKLKEFKNKYSNMHDVYNEILNDLTSGENVEYYFKYGKYKEDASLIGLEFERDLKKIFELEEKCRDCSAKLWKRDLTSYDDIKNGEDFMTVIHASYLLPGTPDNDNYHNNQYSKQYLSCSLISNRELNTFNGTKTLFVMDVDDDNYIASSYVDAVTTDTSRPDLNTLKEIDVNGSKHYIKVGYTNDMKSSVTSISSPKMIERLSVERELKNSGELYRYNSLTNEVVLDRTKTKMKGAILLSDGCDLLLGEYLQLKSLGVKFKCINKGLYRQKSNIPPYTEEEYNNFLISLDSLDDAIRKYNISYEDLFGFYQEAVIPMKYDERVMNDINKKLSFYGIGVSSGRGR